MQALAARLARLARPRRALRPRERPSAPPTLHLPGALKRPAPPPLVRRPRSPARMQLPAPLAPLCSQPLACSSSSSSRAQQTPLASRARQVAASAEMQRLGSLWARETVSSRGSRGRWPAGKSRSRGRADEPGGSAEELILAGSSID